KPSVPGTLKLDSDRGIVITKVREVGRNSYSVLGSGVSSTYGLRTQLCPSSGLETPQRKGCIDEGILNGLKGSSLLAQRTHDSPHVVWSHISTPSYAEVNR